MDPWWGTLCTAILHEKVWDPKSSLAPAGGQFTALNPRTRQRQAGRGPECPKMAQNGSGQPAGREQTASTDLAIRPGAIGARKTASWGPCDPPGLRLWPVCGPFAGVVRVGQMGPKDGQKEKFSNVVPDPWRGSNGPFWTVIAQGQTAGSQGNNGSWGAAKSSNAVEIC